MEQNCYQYFAFISYNSADTGWGKRLQRRLENYRMPSTLCGERGWKRKPINPVFFAPTDIQPGGLDDELKSRLRASRNLIVICSPNSARSSWVGKEIAYFSSLGRTENIFFFIVDGIPHSGDPATECFNPVTETLGLPEILGANIHEKVYRRPWLNRERAIVQLITKLLGVEFDSVWQRHRRRLRRKIAAWSAGAAAVIAAIAFVWAGSRPVDVTIGLREAHEAVSALPPLSDAAVSLTIGGEVKTDTIGSIDDMVQFLHVPRLFIGREARVTVSAPGYIAADTTIVLGRDNIVTLRRDPALYGAVRFTLWDTDSETSPAGCRVTVGGIEAVSDANGTVSLTVPLPLQKQKYDLTADVPLDDDTLYMPCGPNDVIRISAGSTK